MMIEYILLRALVELRFPEHVESLDYQAVNTYTSDLRSRLGLTVYDTLAQKETDAALAMDYWDWHRVNYPHLYQS